MALASLVPIINGIAYTHADIILNLLGVPIIGMTSVSYGDAQAITPNFSTGHEATSVGFGQNTNSGSITLSFEAMMSIQRIAPGGKIQNIPFFDVGINYVPENLVLVRDVLRSCRFTGRQVSSDSGNSEIPVTLELFVAKIDYNKL